MGPQACSRTLSGTSSGTPGRCYRHLWCLNYALEQRWLGSDSEKLSHLSAVSIVDV